MKRILVALVAVTTSACMTAPPPRMASVHQTAVAAAPAVPPAGDPSGTAPPPTPPGTVGTPSHPAGAGLGTPPVTPAPPARPREDAVAPPPPVPPSSSIIEAGQEGVEGDQISFPPVALPAGQGAPIDREQPRARVLEPQNGQKARTGVFWAGIAAIALGSAGGVSFAVTGRVTQYQLGKGYDDGSLTRREESRLQGRGELMNGLALGSAALALVGLGMASVAYGLDYARCGKLARRRLRDDCPASLR